MMSATSPSPDLWDRVRQVIVAEGAAAGVRSEAYTGAGHGRQQRVHRPAQRRGQGRDHRLAGAPRLRPRHGDLAPARLGHQPPALLGQSHPLRLRRALGRSAAAQAGPAGAPARGRQLRRHRQPAREAPDLGDHRQRRVAPERAHRGRTGTGPPRDRHHGHLHGVVVVLRALLLRRRQGSRSIAGGSTIGCRSICTSAASSMRCCTSSTRASSRRRCAIRLLLRARAVQARALPGHGLHGELFARTSDGTGRKECFYPDEVEVSHDAKGKVVDAVSIKDGLPVTVGRVEKMSKSMRNTVDPQQSSIPTAPIPRACSSFLRRRPNGTWNGTPTR